MRKLFWFAMLVASLYAPVQAMTLPPVPTDPIYYEPPVAKPSDNQRQYDCYELDSAINALHPYRYSYKPNYYHDNTNKVATTLIAVDSIPIVEGWLGLGYLAYSSLVEEKESRRMQNVEQQIAMLQRLKAQQLCFE